MFHFIPAVSHCMARNTVVTNSKHYRYKQWRIEAWADRAAAHWLSIWAGGHLHAAVTKHRHTHTHAQQKPDKTLNIRQTIS